MRLCLLTSLGLFATACGLSMNPDLPSAKEDGGTGNEAISGDGDINISIGDGDGLFPIPDLPSEGSGGDSTCLGLGGAGGASGCEDGLP